MTDTKRWDEAAEKWLKSLTRKDYGGLDDDGSLTFEGAFLAGCEHAENALRSDKEMLARLLAIARKRKVNSREQLLTAQRERDAFSASLELMTKKVNDVVKERDKFKAALEEIATTDPNETWIAHELVNIAREALGMKINT